jgi:Helix-hairpin-helix motif
MSRLWLTAISVLAVIAASPLMAQTSAPGAKPSTAAKSTATTKPQDAEPLDINSATKDELQTLNGVGASRADAIIKGRPYKTPHDLVTKKILPESVYTGLKDKIAALQATPASGSDSKPAATSSSKASTTSGAGEFKSEADAKRHCPSDLVVWANTESKVYHYSGSTDYGKTKQGAYMCQKESDSDGFRAARNEKPPAKN